MPNILNTVTKKRKRRVVAGFMGTYIPKSQADYVTLYCNAMGITKISIMKDLLTEWVNTTKFSYNINQLVEITAKKAYGVWKETEGQSFETFLSLLQFELKKKKLEPAIVGEILKLLKDEKNKDI